MLSGTGEQCCPSPEIKDLSQGVGELRHLYCTNRKAHTRREWDEWVNNTKEEKYR